ncbi:MAG: hypothetical protein MJ089_03485 [Ruminococcus sp.]|nr:hypothetical protein [Ruminococcus sp.]
MHNATIKQVKNPLIFSVKVNDYEKLDFKNDALAGVRANYFNSACTAQSDITEVSIDDKMYRLSYSMDSNRMLSWKVTKNLHPYQSVKVGTGGVYSVIFYGNNGIIYKRIYFDSMHNWLRTEYYDKNRQGILLSRIYPVKLSDTTVMQLETIKNGIMETVQLFPSLQTPEKRCAVLAYTDAGMVWYDESYRPSDLQSTKETANNGGFNFQLKHFTEEKELFDITESDYLGQGDNLSLLNGRIDYKDISFEAENEMKEQEFSDKKEVSETYLNDIDFNSIDEFDAESDDKEYSAYDKIERILIEAHKNNKDLFGEIINQTKNTEYEVQLPKKEDSAETTTDEEITPAEDLNDDLKNEEKSDVEITDNTDKASETTEHNENSELKFDTAESAECDVVIVTNSGRYTYYGELDSNKCRTGRGRTVTPDGLTSYDGGYFKDKREGFGVCYYRDGSINYVGNWNNNNRNGCGVGYRLSDGTMHAGKWCDNSPNGYGARFDVDGNFLDVCNYDNGQRNGKSISFDNDGNVIITNWKDGEKISEFTVPMEG